MISVLIRIGTDDYLVPPQRIEIERDHFLALGLYLNAAADNAKQIKDDLALEYLLVRAVLTVERLSAHRHYRLKLGVASELYRRERRITLNDVQLAAGNILRTAVDELLHPV